MTCLINYFSCLFLFPISLFLSIPSSSWLTFSESCGYTCKNHCCWDAQKRVLHLEEIQEPERNSRLIWLTWQRGSLPWKWSSQLGKWQLFHLCDTLKKNQCPRKFFLPQWTQRTQKKKVGGFRINKYTSENKAIYQI